MPLRPEIRKLYGHEWRNYRARIAAVIPPRCKCGDVREQGMNLAHLLHDPKRRDLVEWKCPRCHAKYDTPQRLAMTRRTKARRIGQLWLLPEIEYAPYALWEIPDEVLAGMQEEMFR